MCFRRPWGMFTNASSSNLDPRLELTNPTSIGALSRTMELPPQKLCSTVRKFLLPWQVDEYPQTCASLGREQSFTLVWAFVQRKQVETRSSKTACKRDPENCWSQTPKAGILVVNLTRKKFDRYWDMIDVDNKDWDVDILNQTTWKIWGMVHPLSASALAVLGFSGGRHLWRFLRAAGLWRYARWDLAKVRHCPLVVGFREHFWRGILKLEVFLKIYTVLLFCRHILYWDLRTKHRRCFSLLASLRKELWTSPKCVLENHH